MEDDFNKGIVADFTSERAVGINPVEYDLKHQFCLKTQFKKQERQFFSMYQYRLKHLRDRVHENAVAKWGNGTKKLDGHTIFKQDKILDIKSGTICWVIGTIFCDLKHKLNILNDVEHGTDDVLPIFPSTYVDENHKGTIMIEDESGRAILSNDDFLHKNIFVTGSVVGVLGIEINAGMFEIVDMVYPTMAPQKPMPEKTGGKIAIVSGLDICSGVENDLKLELLKQYLVGELGNKQDCEKMGAINRLIITGNSIQPQTGAINDSKNDFISMNNYGTKNVSKFDNDSLQKFDQFIQEIIGSIPVTIMPGSNDPQEICLPQQSIHKSILHSNKPYMNEQYLQLATNPQWLEINGVRILATSGQNIDDILKYLSKSQIESQNQHQDLLMKIMTTTIKWQNIIPTAPDTLYCYPYDNFDPFVLQETPHIYMVGNQSSFSQKIIEVENKKILLITIPKFSQTGELITIDLDDLTCETIKFEI